MKFHNFKLKIQMILTSKHFSYRNIISHVNMPYDSLKQRTKACLALVRSQHKAKSPELINLKQI